jgi:hypothetical protein
MNLRVRGRRWIRVVVGLECHPHHLHSTTALCSCLENHVRSEANPIKNGFGAHSGCKSTALEVKYIGTHSIASLILRSHERKVGTNRRLRGKPRDRYLPRHLRKKGHHMKAFYPSRYTKTFYKTPFA